jgi:chromosomal replication initiator protein
MRDQLDLPFQGGLPKDLRRSKAKRVTFAQLMTLVCSESKLTSGDMVGTSQRREIVRPRQALMYLACKDTSQSTPWIGRQLGGRDHSTVIHGKKVITRILEEQDPKEKDVIELVERVQLQY